MIEEKSVDNQNVIVVDEKLLHVEIWAGIIETCSQVNVTITDLSL